MSIDRLVMMIFVCLLLVAESFTTTEGSSNTRFSLSEQIVVRRPFNEELHEQTNNNTIIIIDEDQKQADANNKLTKSTAGRLSLYPPIGDRSLADILARNSFSIINKNKNYNNRNRDNQADGVNINVDSRPLNESPDGIDKPTIEDVQCDDGNTFEATIVLPKTFVIEPEFNDLSHDDSLDLLNSYCTINQVKYRLYPTYRILARDYRLCGITSSRQQHQRSGEGGVRGRREQEQAAYSELKSSESSRQNEKLSSSSNNNNKLFTRRRHRRDNSPEKESSPTRRLVSSSNKDDYNDYHPKELVYTLNIRFPVIKSLRTEEDTYATLVCSPERAVESTRREDSGVHEDDGSDRDDNDNQDDTGEEDLAGDDSLANNGAISNNNLKDNEAVVGDESRRRLDIVASRTSPNNATGQIREPLLIQGTFNATTKSVVWPTTLSKQLEEVDKIIEHKSSLLPSLPQPTSSSDAVKNSTAATSLVSVSTSTVAVPFAVDKTNFHEDTIRPTSLSDGAGSKILVLRQPEHRQQRQPPLANSTIKPSAATLKSSTNNTSSLRYNDFNNDHDHEQLQTIVVLPTGRESAGDGPISETKRRQPSSVDKAVVVSLSGNKLPLRVSSESHESLSSRPSSYTSTPTTTIRKHVTTTAKTAGVMHTFPSTNKITKQQMMQTVREPPNDSNNIKENNNDITKTNTIGVATSTKNNNDDEYVDIDGRSTLSTITKQSKTFRGTETHQLNLSLMAFVLSILIIFLVLAVIIELNISTCR